MNTDVVFVIRRTRESFAAADYVTRVGPFTSVSSNVNFTYVGRRERSIAPFVRTHERFLPCISISGSFSHEKLNNSDSEQTQVEVVILFHADSCCSSVNIQRATVRSRQLLKFIKCNRRLK